MIIAACSRKPGDGYITVEVLKFEQVESYTYLLVKEKKAEYWVATSTMNAEVGQSYKYRGGLLMSNFHSEDLNRTFEDVLFLDQLIPLSSSNNHAGQEKPAMQGMHDMPAGMHPGNETTPGSSVVNEKADVKVASVEGAITIEKLFANMKSYEGKAVRIAGEVTKYNASIMERNWVHIQDGTEHQGKYDLTATSIETFEVGSTVIIEGTVALDLDFGYGYTYEILLEEAVAVK